jgi:hypothetical protein
MSTVAQFKVVRPGRAGQRPHFMFVSSLKRIEKVFVVESRPYVLLTSIRASDTSDRSCSRPSRCLASG